MDAIPDDIREKAGALRKKMCIEDQCQISSGCGCEDEITEALLAEREAAIEECAAWHEKNGRLCREAASDDPRLNLSDRARALGASRHHDASAAALRNKLIQERRQAIARAFPEVKQ